MFITKSFINVEITKCKFEFENKSSNFRKYSTLKKKDKM